MTANREAKLLERRPQVVSLSIEELVRRVLTGQVRVPSFQRALRWDERDVARLLDSIHRGYPIGTLLVWERDADAQRVSYGTVQVDAPDTSDAWWAVDGQQRINALVRSLAGAGFPNDRFALFFDLDNGTFICPDPDAKIADQWLPLTEVIDSVQLLEWLCNHPSVNRTLAIEVGKRIREYSIPVCIISADDEEVVLEIFERLNSTHKRMRPAEVGSALRTARTHASPADIREIASRLDELGFGSFDAALLHSMMSATLGVERQQAGLALLDLERAARSVVQFLRETARIPHLALLPYELPIITLTRFFQHFPQAHPRNRELLSRWLWRGAISGEHHDDPTAQQSTLAAIVPNDEHGSVQRLLRLVKRAPPDESWLRDADGKLLALALWSLEPRDLQTDERIEIHNDANDAGGLFPPARITSGLPDDLPANRMIHPMLGGPTLQTAVLAARNPTTLASHALDSDMVGALQNGELDRFRELRGMRLAEVVQRLHAARTQPRQSDRPPLVALLVDDESDGVADDGHPG